MFNKLLKKLFLGFLILTLTNSVLADSTIYLVRHAEKQSDAGSNPGLTELGELRAKNIATFLKDKNITHIFSTDYHRTLQTAEPAAALLKIPVEKYDPRQLAEFAKTLNTLKGTSLVVGHSNTTPNLAFLLGGDPFGAIDESEFDRLYKIVIKDGQVNSQLLFSNPKKQWAEHKILSLDSALFQSRKITFQMSANNQSIGTAVHTLAFSDNEISLNEKTVIEKYQINTEIDVSIEPNSLFTKTINMSGQLGGELDVNLSWDKQTIKGHSTMNRDEFLPQGKIEINKILPSNTYSRTSILMLAHLLPVSKDEIFSINWYNAESDDLRVIEISYQGEETVTVPAGQFETYKIKIEGGAPSQIYYISKEKFPKTVKIEILASPWSYELLE